MPNFVAVGSTERAYVRHRRSTKEIVPLCPVLQGHWIHWNWCSSM